MARARNRDGMQGAKRSDSGAIASIRNAAGRPSSGCATREDLFSVALDRRALLLEQRAHFVKRDLAVAVGVEPVEVIDDAVQARGLSLFAG